MIKIAICDDESKCCNQMEEYLLQYKKVEAVDICIDTYIAGEDLLSINIFYDIVFLDIEMGELDGITVGRKIKENDIRTLIIYTTSYKKYYADAFQIHAYMYLIKPYSYKHISDVVSDCTKYINRSQEVRLMSIRANGKFYKFLVDDIYYFEYVNRKVKVQMKYEQPSFRTTMKKLYEQVSDYDFGIPHSAFIVNFKYVSKIAGYDLILKDGSTIPISQRKIKQFKQELAEYLQKAYYVIH